SPSPANSSRTTPDAGEGTSVSTLSVEISTIVSSASIVSPTAFVQRVIVPSDTLTPIWGMTTSTSVPVAMVGASPPLLVRRQLPDRRDDVVDLGQVRLLERR